MNSHSPNYTSMFKINGVPILQPLMTLELLSECQQWRKFAIERERRRNQRREMEKNAYATGNSLNGGFLDRNPMQSDIETEKIDSSDRQNVENVQSELAEEEDSLAVVSPNPNEMAKLNFNNTDNTSSSYAEAKLEHMISANVLEIAPKKENNENGAIFTCGSLLFAFVKGYLIRKLYKSDRVRWLRKTAADLNCMVEMNESRETALASDKLLKSQMAAVRKEMKEIFFDLSPAKQSKMRTKGKAVVVFKRESLATQKSLARKTLLLNQKDGTSDIGKPTTSNLPYNKSSANATSRQGLSVARISSNRVNRRSSAAHQQYVRSSPRRVFVTNTVIEKRNTSRRSVVCSGLSHTKSSDSPKKQRAASNRTFTFQDHKKTNDSQNSTSKGNRTAQKRPWR